MAVVLGAGGTSFTAAVWYYLKRGGTRGAEVHKDGFVFYENGKSIDVTWPRVIRITAAPDEETHMAVLRIQVDNCQRVLKLPESAAGFAELESKLHLAYGAPEAWVGSARQGAILLYQRR